MDETAAPAPTLARSIGQRLRAGRERAGLSIAAAAEKLHLDNKVIEALEADRFAELGASVYVRGHLRRYADFVGEPGAELVETYTAREVRPPPPDLTQVPHADRRSDPRRLVTPLVGLSAAAVLALALWWVLAGSQSGADYPSGLQTSNEETPVNGATSTPAPTASTEIAAAPLTTTPTTVVTPPPATASSTPATRPEAPVRETRLRLELANDSWVEIYDARGDRLYYDVASAGSVQSVNGRGPLRVVLGDASGVSVQVDGETREIPADAADGEGARFVVNRSGSLTRARP